MIYMETSQGRAVRWIAAAMISLVGLVTHQFYEFPGQWLYSTIIVGPMVIILALIIYMIQTKQRGHLAAVIYGLVHLVGGGLSVFPLDFLPFEPEQTGGHYLSHLIYGLTQLPLIYFALLEIFND